jgi:hypothetical protein
MTLEESRAAHPSNYGRVHERYVAAFSLGPGPEVPTSPVEPRPGALILQFPDPCIPECIPGDEQG